MKLFVGVDQALRKIGVSVVCGDSVELLKLILPPKDLRDALRLQYLEDALHHALEPFPEAVGTAMEGQSYGSDGQIDQLGQIGGIVKLCLLKRYGVSPLVVPPSTLKKFVTGNGQADKSMMMRATKVYWDLEVDQDDICDAHGLARLAQEFYAPTNRYRHQVEAVESLRRKKKSKRIKAVFPKSL
jgi:Holliday junction resolvasome RuvABC endonuclease subunit